MTTTCGKNQIKSNDNNYNVWMRVNEREKEKLITVVSV